MFKDGDLAEYLQNFKLSNIYQPNNRIDFATLKSWFRQLLSGLRFIHEAVAHRDIKPA